MTTTESLALILEDFNRNHKTWTANQDRYTQTIWHSLLGTNYGRG